MTLWLSVSCWYILCKSCTFDKLFECVLGIFNMVDWLIVIYFLLVKHWYSWYCHNRHLCKGYTILFFDAGSIWGSVRCFQIYSILRHGGFCFQIIYEFYEARKITQTFSKFCILLWIYSMSIVNIFWWITILYSCYFNLNIYYLYIFYSHALMNIINSNATFVACIISLC